MKTLITLLLALASLAPAQIVNIAGQTAWGDSLRWGDSDDSTSNLKYIGNAVRKDSSGTWVVITTDSCSKPVRRVRGSQRPIWYGELNYEAWTSTGNTDSSQVKFRFDTRDCLDDVRSLGCGSWVPAGRFKGDTATIVIDSLVTVAVPVAGAWYPTRQIFSVPAGSQIRACVDGHITGGAAGDSLKTRRHVLRFQ